MSSPFPYRRALVTGASSGLGAALCERLAKAGCSVWGTSRDKGRIAVNGVNAVQLDLSDSAAVQKFIDEELPAIKPDLLINAAGCGIFGDLADNTPDDIRRQIEVMLISPTFLCRAVTPEMTGCRSGCIVNVSSLAARFPLPCMPVYNVAKSGLCALSRSLMEETHGKGVVVLNIEPGDFRSNFLKATDRRGGSDTAWTAAEKHLVASPEATDMADKLMQIISRKKSGTYRIGTFFQTELATLVQRILPETLFRKIQRMYTC